MNKLLELLKIFDKGSEKTIGKYECTKEALVSTVIGLMSTVGMTSPGTLVGTTSQAVTITQKDDKYILALNSYNPPIIVEWTDTMPIWVLQKTLMEIIEKGQKIGYLNKQKLSSGEQVFQLGLA